MGIHVNEEEVQATKLLPFSGEERGTLMALPLLNTSIVPNALSSRDRLSKFTQRVRDAVDQPGISNHETLASLPIYSIHISTI